jgi:pimeloyl-ACP methyl ester carboxylesterase
MKTIVWIHGFPLSSAMFEKQRAIEGVRHVMVDLPGFGAEPAPAKPMAIDDYARFVLASFDGQATIAGFSMGGYIALAIARRAPERMEGLILIDTRETADTAEAKKGRYETIEKVRAQGIAPVVDSMLPKMLSENAPQSMKDEIRAIMNTSTAEGVIAALEAMAERPDSSDVLPGIAVPTLVVVGAEDPITPPSDAQRMAAAIPNAKLVTIAGAAHMANFEKADEFNDAVRSQSSSMPQSVRLSV